jgi:glutathione synthase/RimK-type ligase-like ATP-grasp enzyme
MRPGSPASRAPPAARKENRMILILTQFTDDPTVERVCQLVRQHGAEPVVVAPTTMELPSSFSVANGPTGGVSRELRLHDRTIDLAAVDAAFLWRSWRPHPLQPRFRRLVEAPHHWSFFENEWASFHKGLSLALAYSGVFCVNPPPWNSAFEEKCCQLMLAAEVGLTIPPTLFTARLPVAEAFRAAHDGSIIYKPFKPYIRVIQPQGDQPARAQKVLTNRVKAGDLVEPADFIPTPGIFQPYVDKRLELRIVAVGRQLFTCAIHSQQSERSRDDWRRYDFEHTPYEPYDLPAEIAGRLRQLMDRLGLVFGSIDMIVTPAGDYVFLEINPNGQFDFVAQLTGLPIYEALAAMLVAGTTDYPAEMLHEVSHAD